MPAILIEFGVPVEISPEVTSFISALTALISGLAVYYAPNKEGTNAKITDR